AQRRPAVGAVELDRLDARLLAGELAALRGRDAQLVQGHLPPDVDAGMITRVVEGGELAARAGQVGEGDLRAGHDAVGHLAGGAGGPAARTCRRTFGFSVILVPTQRSRTGSAPSQRITAATILVVVRSSGP